MGTEGLKYCSGGEPLHISTQPGYPASFLFLLAWSKLFLIVFEGYLHKDFCLAEVYPLEVNLQIVPL